MLSFFFRNVSRKWFCILMFFLGIGAGWYMYFTQAVIVASVALILVIATNLLRVENADGFDNEEWDSIRSTPHYKSPAYIIPNGVAARLLGLSMAYVIEGLLSFALGLAIIQLLAHSARFTS